MSVDSTHVLIVLPNLAAGGAQLQGVLLARELRDSGLKVAIFLTHSDETTKSNSSVLSGIRTISSSEYRPPQSARELFIQYLLEVSERLGSQRFSNLLKAMSSRAIFASLGVASSLADSLQHNLKVAKACRALRHFLQSEHISVLISFLPQPNLVAVISSDELVKVIVVERNDFLAQPIGDGIRKAQLMTYNKATIVAANSITATNQLTKQFPDSRVIFIPNYLPPIRSEIRTKIRQKQVLVAGRLEPQKRPLEVLEAFCASGKLSSGWRIGFAGSGSLLQMLEARVSELGVAERVSVLGHLDAEDVPYGDSLICVINSDYEGSPNVLAEAICWGAIPLVRRTVVEASEFIPPDLEGALIFDDFSGLVKRFEMLEVLEAKRDEILDKLQSRYKEVSKRYRLDRDNLKKTVSAMVENRV